MTAERASCAFYSTYGRATLHVFAFGEHEEDNILCIQTADVDGDSPVLVRIQSACYTAEIFRSTDCDCHEQLDTSLTRIHAEGGLLIYMICDGRGAGLLTKVRGLTLGDAEGLDTYDAYTRLGVATDPRDYGRVVAVLRALGVGSVRLLTNNPRKVAGLEELGLGVTRLPLQVAATQASRPYLGAKRTKFGHFLDP